MLGARPTSGATGGDQVMPSSAAQRARLPLARARSITASSAGRTVASDASVAKPRFTPIGRRQPAACRVAPGCCTRQPSNRASGSITASNLRVAPAVTGAASSSSGVSVCVSDTRCLRSVPNFQPMASVLATVPEVAASLRPRQVGQAVDRRCASRQHQAQRRRPVGAAGRHRLQCDVAVLALALRARVVGRARRGPRGRAEIASLPKW